MQLKPTTDEFSIDFFAGLPKQFRSGIHGFPLLIFKPMHGLKSPDPLHSLARDFN